MARSTSSQITFGILLLTVGGVLLATNLVAVSTAPAWMLGLGLAFALIAIFRRSLGALVAGGVLLGLGSGMVLGDRGVAGLREGSWIMLGLAAGFLAIYVVGLLLKVSRHPWPLVVSFVLVAIVAARVVRHFRLLPPEVVIAARTWWPAALVVVGLVLLVRGIRR